MYLTDKAPGNVSVLYSTPGPRLRFNHAVSFPDPDQDGYTNTGVFRGQDPKTGDALVIIDDEPEALRRIPFGDLRVCHRPAMQSRLREFSL